MVKIGVGVGSVEDSSGGVINPQIQPSVSSARTQAGPCPLDGLFGDLPIDEQAVWVHRHAGHPVVAVGPGNGPRLFSGAMGPQFELVGKGSWLRYLNRVGDLAIPASPVGLVLGLCGWLACAALTGRLDELGDLLPDAFCQRHLAEFGSPFMSQPLAAFEKLVMGALGQPFATKL